MMNFDPNTIQQAADIARHGSPLVLQAAGRMLGLGQNEQDALLNGKIPFFVWLAAGVAVGWFVGVQAQKRRWAPGYLSSK